MLRRDVECSDLFVLAQIEQQAFVHHEPILEIEWRLPGSGFDADIADRPMDGQPAILKLILVLDTILLKQTSIE